MLKNYLKIAWRSLLKRKLYTVIHLTGLATAVAFCLLVYLFICQEYSFDRFHDSADRIVRIDLEGFNHPDRSGKEGFLNSFVAKDDQRSPLLSVPLGPAMKNGLPEVKSYLRFKMHENMKIVLANEQNAFEEHVLYTDPNFFEFFSFKLKDGNPATALSNPNSIVLTEDAARKYFGDQQAVGKTLMLRGRIGQPVQLLVTGIVEKAPDNSSIQYSVILPIRLMPFYDHHKNEPYDDFSVFTLLQLKPGTDMAKFERKLYDFSQSFFREWIQDAQARNEVSADAIRLRLTRLIDTHFGSGSLWPQSSNRLYSYVLASIALLILLVTCTNYVSLALAGAATRIQQIGIRKVVGATRKQLITQLFIELSLLLLTSLFLGILLTRLFLPAFSTFTGTEIALSLNSQLHFLPFLLGLLIITGLLAGFYPAWVISGFSSKKILQNNLTYHFKPLLPQLLTLGQFIICVFLIVSALIMKTQMRFMLEKELGFDKDQLLVINNYERSEGATARLLTRFKRFADNLPGVTSVAGCAYTIGEWGMVYSFPIGVNAESEPVHVNWVSYDYVPTMGLKLIKGRNFSPKFAVDTLGETTVVINQTLAEKLGADLRLGEPNPQLAGSVVIGVLKDFHFGSMEKKIGPVMLQCEPDHSGYLLAKVKGGRITAVLENIQKQWPGLTAGQPFEYSFVDDDVAAQYGTYKQWMRMTEAATLLAILIACLGLFGLAGLNTIKRTKEVGVRKIMGASVIQVFSLLTQNIIKITLLSFIVAMPMAYFLMNRWLEDFAYRAPISWEIFLLSGLSGLFAALAAVSFHSVKAALMNPVSSLRAE